MLKSHIERIQNGDKMDSMKTTVDIPDDALADAMRFTGAKTKREAVVRAIEDFNRQQRVKEVVAGFGTLEFASNDEIEAGDMQELRGSKIRTARK
jgi:Bacterial antitoxin of type II TA system, VapB